MSNHYRIMAPRPQAPLTAPVFHTWAEPDGTDWARFCRLPDGYLVRFTDHADYEITADGLHATCWPAPEVDAPTLEHLFHNQVWPLMLSLQQKLVFHGSAVSVGTGAVAFLGRSGQGKSTLAAAFAVADTPFLTDDALLIEADGSEAYSVLPGQPAIRLWDDSRSALLHDDAPSAPAIGFTDKQRFLAEHRLPHLSAKQRLLAAYFLADDGATEIRIEALQGADRLTAWTQQAFVLEMENPERLGAQFAAESRLAYVVPGFVLDFPRRFDQIDMLKSRIVEHAMRLVP